MKLFTTWGAALFASAFSFLSNLMMARLLSLSDYAAYINFLSIMGVMNMLQPSIQSITARQISLYAATNGPFYAQVSLKRIWWLGLVISILGGVLLWLSAPWLATIMLSDLGLINLLPLTFSFSLLFAISMGGLQGLQRIRSLAFATVVNAFLRLPISWLLVVLGLKLQGAILALSIVACISTIITSALGVFLNISSNSSSQVRPTARHFSQLYPRNNLKNMVSRITHASFLPTLTHISFLLLTSLDIIFMKRFLPEDQQSYYALIATLGKIALYTTQPIAILLLPRATTLVGQGKSAFNLLKQSLWLTMVIGLLTCVALLIVGSWITYLFMPSFPSAFQPFIVLYAGTMSLIGLVYILNTYCIALNIINLSLLQVIAILVMMGIFFTQRLSIMNAIGFMLITFVILCIMGFIICYRNQSLTKSERN